MRITEVRIRLLPQRDGGDKLRGFCTITLDEDFVVRDLKIIEGPNGAFIAMPSRRLMDRCERCRQKNHLKASFCNECGAALRKHRLPRDERGRPRLYVDIAHPINAASRGLVHRRVLEELQRERERARTDGYVFASSDDEDLEWGFESSDDLDQHKGKASGEADVEHVDERQGEAGAAE